MYFRQPGESWPTYPEYLPWYGYAAASPYQVMAPIIIPFPYPGAYSQVPMNTVSYPDSGLNDRSRSFASDDASTPFTRSNRSR